MLWCCGGSGCNDGDTIVQRCHVVPTNAAGDSGLQCWTSHTGGLLLDFDRGKSQGHNLVWIQEGAWAVCCRCEDPEKAVGCGQQMEIVTNLVRLWLGFDKCWKFPGLRRVVKVLLLTVGKCSYMFDFSDVGAGVMDLNESSSVLLCVRSWFSHEGRSSSAEMTAALVRVSQGAMSQRERLLVPSRMSPWLQVCFGNSRALEEEYISKWLGHGSPLLASATDPYVSAFLASLSSKQKKVPAKTQTGKRSGGVPLKLKKPVKKVRF